MHSPRDVQLLGHETAQLAPKNPSLHEQTPPAHTPCPEQSFGQRALPPIDGRSTVAMMTRDQLWVGLSLALRRLVWPLMTATDGWSIHKGRRPGRLYVKLIVPLSYKPYNYVYTGGTRTCITQHVQGASVGLCVSSRRIPIPYARSALGWTSQAIAFAWQFSKSLR